MRFKAEELLGGRFEMDIRDINIVDTASTITLHISFNKAFSAPPIVVISSASGQIGDEEFINTSVTNVTADGFDATFSSLSGTESTGVGSFVYQAFGN